MRRTVVLWCAFMTRFVDAQARYRGRGLTAEEAGELLGMSGRHFRRLCARYDEEGVAGLRDRRLGRVSSRRADTAEIARMRQLYRERYSDFTVKHFHEALRRQHHYTLGYTVTRLALQSAGLVTKAVRRSAHRKKRQRRPLPGMLLFQDGSTHCWLPGSEAKQDLIVTLDDATGEIYSMFLIEEEGTQSSFLGLSEVIGAHGLFSALYTDRGSHYFFTQTAGGKVDKQRLTQVGRALSQLGIRHIPSYSPEARGRMERAFGTLQNRLPQELRVAGCSHHGGGERVSARAVHAELQFALWGRTGRTWLGLRRLSGGAAGRGSVHSGGSPGRPRQLRALAWHELADPASGASAALREGDGPGEALHERQFVDLRRTTLPGPLR